MSTTTASASNRSPAAPRAPLLLGRVSWWRSALALMRLSWVRTVTPVLLLSVSALVLLPMLFALVFASRGALSGDPVPFLLQRFDSLVFALATPIIALLLGTSAFGAEADDGTLLYIVTTTTPRWWVVLVRVLFATLGTALLSAIAVTGTSVIAVGWHDPDRMTRAFVAASAFGGATYAALFTLLSLLTRRALVGGLVYVLFWEGILSTTFPAIHYLSVRQWMLAIARALTTASATVSASAGAATAQSGPSARIALVFAVVLIIATVVVGGRALRRPRLSRIGT